MYIFGHHVVGEDKCFLPQFDHGRIVEQSPRRRIARQRAHHLNESGFSGQPRFSFATASSRPLTNLASFLSKKACATSTYSSITAAVGTSARARSS